MRRLPFESICLPIVCQLAKSTNSPNQKAPENINVFRGFIWLRGQDLFKLLQSVEQCDSQSEWPQEPNTNLSLYSRRGSFVLTRVIRSSKDRTAISRST